MKTKYLILGAGPAGLAFANTLLKKGETDFVVIEKESEPGGLCRSADVDGSPLDIGGGHFLDVRRPSVCRFLFEYLPENEWDRYDRDSRIRVSLLPNPDSAKKKEYELHHPFEANIWELPSGLQKRFLESIASAGCNTGEPKPEKFTDWITWKLGTEIAKEYMLPYNRKMFGRNLNELGTYWLEKLPNVSYEETLESCKQKKALGSQPGHAQFYYPKKYGYGEVWIRMGDALGDKLKLNETVTKLDCMNCEAYLSDGGVITADTIIVTVPWDTMELMWAPSIIKNSVKILKKTAVEITYMEEAPDSEAQWIYYPDEELSYHRILIRGNFLKGAKGCWTETRSERYEEEVKQLSLFDAEDGAGLEGAGDSPKSESRINFHNEYAYPVNTISKPTAIGKVLDFAAKSHIYGLGRWGEHDHFNSDVTVERAIKLAEKMLG